MAAADTAVESALRALRHRDRSAHEIDARLRREAFSDDEREDALETLRRTGLVDDTRFAHRRAAALAARGKGDELIRHTLRAAGVARDAVEEALAEVEPERTRAERIVRARGAGERTARYLAARGFAHDAASVARERDDELR